MESKVGKEGDANMQIDLLWLERHFCKVAVCAVCAVVGRGRRRTPGTGHWDGIEIGNAKDEGRRRTLTGDRRIPQRRCHLAASMNTDAERAGRGWGIGACHCVLRLECSSVSTPHVACCRQVRFATLRYYGGSESDAPTGRRWILCRGVSQSNAA